ncbi:flagellar protein FlaG [Stappia stellulata]|uniref:flagellar protein FlaG n=1 Tax=Stappia stellulata TaxID=71235 RepID=UPI00040704DA|nr:flagellar protein FlaG [Stappia stellulata]
METGVTRAPAYQTALVPTRGREAVNPPSAPTDVPAEKAVQPSQESTAMRPEAENPASQRPVGSQDIKREEYRDTITDSLVFRAIDTETGEVVRQIPDESLLRLRRAFAETTHKDMTGLDVNRSL